MSINGYPIIDAHAHIMPVRMIKPAPLALWRETYKNMPFGRPASVDEVAATAVFLCSDLSSYTSGTIVTIDGGMTHVGALP